jgi:hypothetical protein
MSKQQKESLIIRSSSFLLQNPSAKCPENPYSKIQSSEPLWKRVPTRDQAGNPYNDFMMVIPGLRNFEPSYLREIINKIEIVLKTYEKVIILADLNLKINILWITVQPHIGLSTEIAAILHHVVPEAKLVSQNTA